MSRPAFIASLIALLPAIRSDVAVAESRPAPLQVLPAADLRAVAPLLRSGAELALIESDAQGTLKQVTTMTLVAAPPGVVHDVVAHPERYGEFVRNMTRSTVRQLGPDTFEHSFEIDYQVTSVNGRHRYQLLAPGPGEAAGAIDMTDPEDDGVRHLRWEFVPWGGGTLIVLYAYTYVPRAGFWKRYLDAVPTLEYGLALTAQMTLMLSMKARAQEISRAPPPFDVKGGGGSYRPLLQRGLLAFFRSTDGQVAEVSMVTRTRAPAARLLEVAGGPARWADFVPSISKSYDAGSRSGLPAAHVTQSIPLMSWETTWGSRSSATTVDLVGLDGDLRGARMRWDVTPTVDGSAQLTLRSSIAFERSSMIVRRLYRIEPTFAYGFNVGLTLVVLRGVEARAEQRGRPPAPG